MRAQIPASTKCLWMLVDQYYDNFENSSAFVMNDVLLIMGFPIAMEYAAEEMLL